MNKQKTQTFVKGNDVIGLQVISLEDGKQLHTVKDVIYDSSKHQVLALLISEGGRFSEAEIIPIADIDAIGEDAVIISHQEKAKKASEISEKISTIAKDSEFLTNTKIITEDGNELGKVSDIYFDPKTGKVDGFEVSQGLKNLQSGKKRVRVNDIITVGEDATIVSTYVEENFEEQASQQGMTGMFQKAQESVKDVVNDAKTEAPGLAQQIKQKAQEVGQKTKENTQELTEKVQEKAEDKKTQQKMQGVQSAAQDALKKTQQTVSQATGSAKEKLDDGKGKVIDQRKKDALGKYVEINILGSDDTILAHRGEMITNRILQIAEENGSLEQVLSNTSQEPIEITSPIVLTR